MTSPPEPPELVGVDVGFDFIATGWTDVPGAAVYELRRDGDMVAVLPRRTVSYHDAGLTSGTEYTYDVRGKTVASYADVTALQLSHYSEVVAQIATYSVLSDASLEPPPSPPETAWSAPLSISTFTVTPEFALGTIIGLPHRISTKATVYYGVDNPRELNVIDGSVTASGSGRVRRTCELIVAPDSTVDAPDIAPVWPYGSKITVWRNIVIPSGQELPYEVFSGRIDVVEQGFGEAVRIRASDLAAQVQDARFEQPRTPPFNQLITDTMIALIREAVGATTVVNVEFAYTDRVSGNTGVWERDRGEALDQLARSIGAEWYHERGAVGAGVIFTIRPVPALGGVPDWLIQTGPQGTIVREVSSQDRESVYNAVIAIGEPTDQPSVRAVAYDNNPASPTRYNGPFGNVPRFYSSPFIYTVAQAQAAANAILAKAIGLSRQRIVETVPNPGMQIGDLIELILPDLTHEQHIVDSYTLPLGPEGAMTLTNRSIVEVEEEAT